MSVDVAKRRIIQRVPLVTLIGERVSLVNRGGRHIGCCPFHDEKTPSFHVFDDHYHCFGCKKHGDAIEFVKHDQGVGFIEALRYLAAKYGIEVPELDASGEHRHKYSADAVYYQIHIAAQRFFVQNIQSKTGEKAIAYLKGRGFTDETIAKYQFGLAINDPFALVQELMKANFKQEDIIAASLGSLSERTGRAYDFFQNRVMIPIHDKHGRIIAFGGRALGDDPAKYKNSRETSIFDKSGTVYGFHTALAGMREHGHAMVVEGYMDALQLWNNHFTQAVACMGTALTVHHLRQLAQVTKVIYLVFDGDKAGQAANLRTAGIAVEVPQVTLKVVRIPGDDDPDSFLRAHGPTKFQELVDGAQDLLDFAFVNILKETEGLAVTEVLKNKFIPWLRSINDQVKRVYLTTRLSKLTDLPYEELDSMIRGAPAMTPVKAKAVETPIVTRPLELPTLFSPEFELLAHIYYSNPGQIDDSICRHLMSYDLALDEILLAFGQRMLDLLQQQQLAPHATPPQEWLFGLPPELFELINEIKKAARAFIGLDRNQQLLRLSNAVKLKKLKTTRSQLKNAMCQKDARTLPIDEVKRILTAIAQVNDEIKKLDHA